MSRIALVAATLVLGLMLQPALAQEGGEGGEAGGGDGGWSTIHSEPYSYSLTHESQPVVNAWLSAQISLRKWWLLFVFKVQNPLTQVRVRTWENRWWDDNDDGTVTGTDEGWFYVDVFVIGGPAPPPPSDVT